MTRIGFAYNMKPPVDHAGAPSSSLPANAGPAANSGTTSTAARAEEAALVGASVAESDVDDEYAEWDSVETIDAIAGALAVLGDVVRIEANEDFPSAVRDARPDIVFNIAEGRGGPSREAHVPAILEFLGIPYSGSDPFTLALCLDKARAKEALSFYGIPTPQFARVSSPDQLQQLTRLPYPAFAKPVHEGSSKGITGRSICRDAEELREQVEHLLDRYHEPVLIEAYLPGEEFTVAIVGNPPDLSVLPTIGMRFDALPAGAPPIFGFEAKWIWDTREHPLPIYECPARIDEGLQEALESVALRTYTALGCRDWGRIDLRLDERGVPNVIEVNPLPGIAPNPSDHSCFPMAARAAGIAYEELMQRVLLLAAHRSGVTIRNAPAFPALPRRTPPHGIPLRMTERKTS